MGRKPFIHVIGSLNIDFVTVTPRMPGPGETLTATSMTVHGGGKGANQAVACGRAAFHPDGDPNDPKSVEAFRDVNVKMIGAVGAGDPYYASLLRPILEDCRVDTENIEELQGVETGSATILVDEGASGENRILIVPGANSRVGPARRLLEISCADGVVPDVVVMQGEIPRFAVLELLRTFNSTAELKKYHTGGERRDADHRTCCVVFNPAPMFPDGIPLDALRGLAVLVVNETECLQLFQGVPELGSSIEVPTSEDALDETQLDRLVQPLHKVAQIAIVVVTLGSRGVYYSHSTSASGSTRSRGMIPAGKVAKVVDTTAAGDTFVGFFATALARHMGQDAECNLKNFDAARAIERANRAAAQCVQREGAMKSIPRGDEIPL